MRLDPLLKCGQRTTLVMEPAGNGKVRLTYHNWESERVILETEALEIVAIDKMLYAFRAPRRAEYLDIDPSGVTTSLIEAGYGPKVTV
jgi:hypothetical protein